MLRPLPRSRPDPLELQREKEEQERAEKERKEKEEQERQQNQVIRPRDYLVGDGGASWRARAKLRHDTAFRF